MTNQTTSSNHQPDLSPLTFWQELHKRANTLTFLLVLCGGTLFLCLAGVLFVNMWEFFMTTSAPASPAIQLPSGDAAAVPTYTPVPAQPTQDAGNVLDEGVHAAAIELPPPTALQVQEQTLPVYSRAISGSELFSTTSAENVRWVRNSFVNYVFQLPPTAANQQLLQNLVVGDAIVLTTAAGETKQFMVSGMAQVAPDNTTLQQTEPSITLVWPGTAPLIVYGRYADLAGQPPVKETIVPTAEWTDEEYVTLTKGGLSQDGTSLLLAGTINNSNNTLLTFQESDLLLTGQGQLYPILEASPPWPWNIAPGETLSFIVRAQRPDGPEAVLQIRNQAFSLQNLR